MRILTAILSLALAADFVAGSTWLSSSAYNKWHQTELEQWLSDHDIPYPAAADRKKLQDLVEKNWEQAVVAPYHSWDVSQLTSYLQVKGLREENKGEVDRKSLLSRVQQAWYETEEKTQHAYLDIKEWILETWTDSQLKAFCDYHSIPVPQPRSRDVLLQNARKNYEEVATKAHQTFGYPGNWLYDTWTDSELKRWLVTYGFSAPQPSTRDKLIATVRRNSHLAYLQLQDESARLKKGISDAHISLQDSVLDRWSESELKNFCDKNGIKVPQGSQVNEVRALIRKRRAEILKDTASARASSAFGAATSKAGNEYAQATNQVSEAARAAFDAAVGTWSNSRLKEFLDARGVPVPQHSTIEQLRALVRKNSHLVATGGTAWTFDDLSYDNLRDYLVASGDEAAKAVAEKSGAVRADLVQAAHSVYTSASKAGGDRFAAATSYLTAATQAAKSTVFDTWSESELKVYLDTYGVSVPQGSTANELRAYARQQATYFRYGTLSPSSTLYAKASEGFSNAFDALHDTVDWAKSQVLSGVNYAKKQAEAVFKKANDEL